MVTGDETLVCRKIENAAFFFRGAKTVQVSNDSIVCTKMNKEVFRISALESDNPQVQQLQDLPFEGNVLEDFSVASFNDKLVILTGGYYKSSNQACVYAFEVATGNWKAKDTLPSLSIPRSGHGSCAVGGALYVVGG